MDTFISDHRTAIHIAIMVAMIGTTAALAFAIGRDTYRARHKILDALFPATGDDQ